MASLRDGRVNRLYASEQSVFEWEPDLDTEADVQAWCDKIVRSSKFKALWAEYHPDDPPRRRGGGAPKRVLVKTTRGWGAHAYANSLAYHRGQWLRYIEVGAKGRCRWVVLHELAHIIDPDCGHGRSFARIYLLLVRRFLPESAPALVVSFKEHRVKYTKPSHTNGEN